MHCAGCHAAAERPEFSKPADHGYPAIGDFRMGLHMIPGHELLAGIEARRLDRAEHKVELSDDAGVVAGYNKVAVYAQDQFDVAKRSTPLPASATTAKRSCSMRRRLCLALVYTPNDKLVVRGGYSTAFRFPHPAPFRSAALH
jgi:hypothetical protein